MSAVGDMGWICRIIDANANRAGEALRVLEECARFVIDDAYLTSRFKSLRHALIQNIRALQSSKGLDPFDSFRDTVGDVGTVLETPTETRREDLSAVLSAASNRLGQSLRVLEEYGKQLDASTAARFERLRYDSYVVAAHLLRRIRPQAGFSDVRLCVLISEVHCPQGWFETAETVLRSGAQAIQLREKDLSDAQLVDRGRRLRALCDRHAALLMINDRADIARAVSADGVHLGQDDIPIAEARRILGPDRIVGISTHGVEQAENALLFAPDYIAVGPMFASKTKPRPDIAGPQTLSAVRELTSLPLVAIGGINPQNVAALGAANGVAVCAAITLAQNVAAAARKLLSAMPAPAVAGAGA